MPGHDRPASVMPRAEPRVCRGGGGGGGGGGLGARTVGLLGLVLGRHVVALRRRQCAMTRARSTPGARRSAPWAPSLGRGRGWDLGMEMSSSGRVSWAQASSTMSSSRSCPSRMMQAIRRRGLLLIAGRLSSSQPHARGRHGTAPLASGPRHRTRTAASSQPSPALPTRRQKGPLSTHGSDTKAP